MADWPSKTQFPDKGSQILASKTQFSDKDLAKFRPQKPNFPDNLWVELLRAWEKSVLMVTETQGNVGGQAELNMLAEKDLHRQTICRQR